MDGQMMFQFEAIRRGPDVFPVVAGIDGQPLRAGHNSGDGEIRRRLHLRGACVELDVRALCRRRAAQAQGQAQRRAEDQDGEKSVSSAGLLFHV